MPRAFPATVIDPNGRTVHLTEERWGHIVAGHPELESHLVDMLAAVRDPRHRLRGRREDEEWFYLDKIGPSRWLKVVVRYGESGDGWIVTAFARRSMP